METVTFHCVFCKRMTDVPASDLQHTSIFRCQHCRALRMLTEKEKQMLRRSLNQSAGES